MFKWLTESYPPRDVFECNNCGKKTPGRWCGYCPGERGTYWDKNGTPSKPTARINPKLKDVVKMKKQTVWFRE
ncbi:hypothetical protein [Paenibacillus sp. NRS-1781]|uniref:hypothetical protein n=1 Tax=Paenibacillus sp. NRS-1781 TaxID=3233905 RepID=UPI003D29E91F